MGLTAPTSSPDPAFVQRNIQTLSQIGGLYDLIALRVEADHAELLTAWRLDNPAKSAVELLRDRDHRSTHQHTDTPKERNAEDDNQARREEPSLVRGH